MLFIELYNQMKLGTYKHLQQNYKIMAVGGVLLIVLVLFALPTVIPLIMEIAGIIVGIIILLIAFIYVKITSLWKK